MALETTIAAGALLFVLWIAWAVVVFVRGKPWIVDLEHRCHGAETQCGVFLGFGSSLLTFALVTAVFLVWRLWRAKQPIARKARTNAREFVPTAAHSTMEKVVGRDELCDVINQELKDREARRPYLLIGGVGAGKTAVMVHLTELLAQRGAIPVPVRLRDVGDGTLDFSELARARFCREVDEAMLRKGPVARAIGEHAWRWLRKEDRVVVLADGLEEVFAEGEKERDRDNLIRRAIREAAEQELPLVIASRPHAPLRDVEAAVTELEPLSEEAALAYIGEGGHNPDEHRVDWVVERADVTEAPLYLQITKQLYQHQRLEYVVGRSGGGRLDTRGVDRAGLRRRLLTTWTDALVDGHLRPELALPRQARRAAVDYISALACIGLAQDSLEVRFEDLLSPDDSECCTAAENLRVELAKRLAELHGDRVDADQGEDTREPQSVSHASIALAATWGEQLGLVEAHGDRVRFQHSIMEAYLGSRFMDVALTDPSFLSQVLDGASGPSREFLISMVFRSRGEESSGSPAPHTTIDELVKAAERRRDEKSLYLYATALEVDSARERSQYPRVAASLRRRWRLIESQDHQGLSAAKFNLVHRFGDVLRRAATDGEETAADNRVEQGYRELFGVACEERSYEVRLAIAEQIGSGGSRAFKALCQELEYAPTATRTPEQTFEEQEKEDKERRRQIMCAWLIPMLVGSVSNDTERRSAKRCLVGWLACVRPDTREYRECPLPLHLEIALSQGFKAAANRRARHFATCPEARVILVEQAQELLTYGRFWYTQLTLIQALTLWALADSPNSTPHRGAVGAGASPRRRVDQWLSTAGKGTEAERERLLQQRASRSRRVDRRWSREGRGASTERTRLHPFVREAADLSVRALESAHPERCLWIDETGVISKVGSHPSDPTQPRMHNLWIPPSTGWTALDRRAQQLVADVLLLLNLSDRGEADEHERHLHRANRNDLPSCLTGDRTTMQPDLSIARPGMSNTGSSCADGCAFGLCPYPPRGTPQRQELGEAFCRRQQTLLSPWPTHWFARGPAPWQRTGLPRRKRALQGDLRLFWKTMADRKRVPHSGGGAR
jgi:NACHT domain